MYLKLFAVLALGLAAQGALAQGSRSQQATSTFTGSENPLSEGGNWDQMTSGSTGDMRKASDVADSNNYGFARWVGAGTFNESQYSSATLTDASGVSNSSFVGVLCNGSADDDAATDYFAYYIDENTFGGNSGDSRTTLLVRVVNGASTTIDSDSVAWSAGDEIECEYDADTDTLYGLKNGTPTSSGTAATIGTGRPGVLSQANFSVTEWFGGTVTFGAPSSGLLLRRRRD